MGEKPEIRWRSGLHDDGHSLCVSRGESHSMKAVCTYGDPHGIHRAVVKIALCPETEKYHGKTDQKTHGRGSG